ncbi:transposase [Limnoraphis robusta Tam1]|uniref:Transposase n=1 Tax=Limnoraphis robusta CCNP1315 TaxID=3110306 RepID=A0ABU5TRT1_9CYAN|nr:transposase [Limnoraphis robusta]MEA5498459.1 transposase [Limnoraphis robusta BA-68 BA1]MEA5517425.1 transposase [Limnoraphis robusta CCNP1315]MEA5542400.1 transposase [Limnoraphis robusta Tam1]MEA5545987.1 transposase [Limnoraphis robusta CCNP1324]
MLTRRLTYRLYLTKQQEDRLHYARKLHCLLYNAAVANRRTQYHKFNHSVNYLEQQNSLPAFKEVWTDYKQLGSHALQATLKRVDFAFQRFFNGLSKYPKFKSSRFYGGWTYPDKQSWKVHSIGDNGYLELKDLGFQVQMRGKARTWGDPTTCTILWKNGLWYASLTVNCEPVRELGREIVGADFGCKTAIAFSDGTIVESPKFLKQAESEIKKLSKQLRRKQRPIKGKQKGSRRWKKVQSKLAKVKRKVANQRVNWVHQVAADLTSRNSIVVTEKINLKGMTRKAKKGSKRKRQKAGLNKSLLDVGIGMLKQAITYKLEEGKGFVVHAPTKQLKPTQRCNECWELTPKSLSDRLHICQHCSNQDDRDINSAKVCLTWYRRKELASSVADESSSTSKAAKFCGSMRQLAQMKRQKPPSQSKTDGV